MAQPKVAARSPVQIDLEQGEHHWCACGESKAQPFCDEPAQLVFDSEEQKEEELADVGSDSTEG